MGELSVEFTEPYKFIGQGNAWCVILPKAGGNRVLLYGFGRRRDAELALDILSKAIDWTQDCEALRLEWREGGGMDGWMKKVVEHLQW